MPSNRTSAISPTRSTGLTWLRWGPKTASCSAVWPSTTTIRSLIDRDREHGRQRDVYRITNNSTQIIDTHLLMVARGLPRQIELANGDGKTQGGDPYLRVFLKDGVIMPGKSITVSLMFKRDRKDPRAIYSLGLLSGQGKQP
jgi:hypothetical protein